MSGKDERERTPKEWARWCEQVADSAESRLAVPTTTSVSIGSDTLRHVAAALREREPREEPIDRRGHARVPIGSRIMAIREKRGMTQTQLAEATGYTQGAISQIEGGQRDPSWGGLVRLADALGARLSFGLAAEPQPEREPDGVLPPVFRQELSEGFCWTVQWDAEEAAWALGAINPKTGEHVFHSYLGTPPQDPEATP